MSEGKLRVERDGPIGRLVLDNPARRNAIGGDMWRAISKAMAELDADPAIRCIVLRGEGTAAFAAGADISEFEQRRSSEADVKAYEALVDAAHHSIENSPKPVIALIHGFCVGGGMAVALSCDLRYADASSRFAIPAARLGLGYGVSGTNRLVATVGHAAAREIMFSARRKCRRALATQHDAADRGIGIEFCHGLGNRAPHFPADRVAARRVIQHQPTDRSIALDAQFSFAHTVS